MKKYFVYLESGDDVIKVAVPANNEKEARAFCEGNGEVIAIRDITDRYPISKDYIAKALINAGFGQTETDLVTRALYTIGIAD